MLANKESPQDKHGSHLQVRGEGQQLIMGSSLIRKLAEHWRHPNWLAKHSLGILAHLLRMVSWNLNTLFFVSVIIHPLLIL